MLTRRCFTAFFAAGVATPFVTPARAQVAEVDSAIAELTQLHALVVQRGDEVVISEAPRGPGLEHAANIKSCSKSILALLLGSAIGQGEIADLDATLGQIASPLIPGDATEGVVDLTMLDLVTLRAGLEGTSGPNYGAWVESRNWVSHALRRPMISEPGTRMIYSTGTTHVLGAVLATVTGDGLLSLTRSRLGEPLDFDVAPWTRDPQGFYLGGNEMALTPRAMLKIALLMRDGGRFDGQQVIPEAWVQASQVPRTQSPYSGLGYGYGWFVSSSGYVIARGYGGQIIAAHPGRGLAVALTSDPNQPARSEGYFGALMRLLDGPILSLA
ncbi:MAG: 6-aminohexanoate hydrolase [Cereibacter sphaeroides]|uniref:6-aminohexanoate hydrolase n=1 Tax=Cereibacter sphaeroides TaxID=1063 RepID=A0A2W5S8G0_CERSP|nr:MAG: 6-aminohexanoate hydrolase [Cereibacter sphaeroides]